jgi:hypothetical protein
MKTTLVSLVLASLFVVSLASAKPKAKKPVTCLQFKEDTLVIDGENAKVAICSDGAKPVILTTYTVTTIKNDEGTSVRAAVGYR